MPIDRYWSSSHSCRINSSSAIRANSVLGTLLPLVYMSPVLVIYQWNEHLRTCLPQTSRLISIYVFSLIVLYYVVALLFMFIFGLLTISNIARKSRRAKLLYASIRRRRTERQLDRMLLLQVSVHLILILPSNTLRTFLWFSSSIDCFIIATVTRYLHEFACEGV